MKLYLSGHEYKYATEQIMLTLFPEEKPEYPEGSFKKEENSARITLGRGEEYATARTTLCRNGTVTAGTSRVKTTELKGKLITDRLLQKILRLSFYKAAVRLTGKLPAWGALTGIRPGKMATELFEKGATEKKVRSVLEKEYFLLPSRSGLCIETAKASLAVQKTVGPRGAALYIGIPFCPTRCAYCSFVSQSVAKSMKLIEPFLDAMHMEMAATAELLRELNIRIISVYMGGGTPTTLSAAQLEALLNKLYGLFDLSSMREFTVEAGRPDTITEDKLRVLKGGGVTRISVNPQTMSDEVLKAIGRSHTAGDIIDAVAMARAAGIGALNMDLIAGLPADTVEGFKRTLDEVMGLGPENITVHTLSRKKGSRITEEGTLLPGGGHVEEMLDYAGERLGGGGYAPYYLYRQKYISGGFENVGWAKRGYENLYNICIMEELCSVIAMGGGGSTKLVAESGRIERIFNPKYPTEYINSIDKVIAGKDEIRKFYEMELV